GLDQIGNQIMALLELHVDVGKGLADALAERDQTVIRSEREENENNDDADNDPAGRHDEQLLMGRRIRQGRITGKTKETSQGRPPRGGYPLGLAKAERG